MNDSQARQIAWREQRHRRGTRAAAIMLGAKRGRSDAIQLVCLLNDRDPTIRQSAIRSLAQIGGASAVEAIARRVGDTDPSVRAAACRALGHMRAHSARGPLLDALRDRDREVICAAADALARMGDKAGLPHIARLVRKGVSCKWEALRALNLMVTGQQFPVSQTGLEQAVRWIERQGRKIDRG